MRLTWGSLPTCHEPSASGQTKIVDNENDADDTAIVIGLRSQIDL